MPYSMLIVRGPNGTEEINLNNLRITIGRSDDNDLPLRDPKVSRCHAVLEVTAAGWKVSDRGSGNGILVNGQEVLDQILKDGDEIRIGASVLTLRVVTDAEPAPPPPAPAPKPAPSTKDTQIDTDRVPVLRRRRGRAGASGGIAIGVIAALLLFAWIFGSGGGGYEPLPPKPDKDRKTAKWTTDSPEAAAADPLSAGPREPKKADPKRPSSTDKPLEFAPGSGLASSSESSESQPDKPLEFPPKSGGGAAAAEPPKEPPKTPLGRLTAMLLDGIAKKTIQMPYVPLGKDNWQVCGGTFDVAKLARNTKFEEVRWDSIVPEGLYKAFKALGTKPEVRLDRADYALASGLVEEGFDELASLHKEKPERKAEIDAVLARAFGESVPAGGYVHFRGEWMSESDQKVLVARERVTALIDEIGALPQVAEAKRTIKKDLRTLQRKCVAFIQSDAYTYATQQDVNTMVDDIRDIWDKPYEYLKKKYPDWQAPFRATVDTLIGRKIGPDAPLEQAEVEASIARQFEIKDWAMDGADKSMIENNRRIMDQNRRLWSVANPEEMELLSRINEYRRMIGLNVGALDELLLLASRHHSLEMRRLQYFGHFSPIPKRYGPSERAGEEGTGGGSENCAMGGAVPGAFNGWYNSPPHHRNMISGDVLGPGGCEGYQTLQVGGSPSAKKDNLMPEWLVAMRAHPVGGGESARGASVRRQYLRSRLAVLKWLMTGERPESIREFRGGGKSFAPFLVKDMKSAAGAWLAALLDMAGELKIREAIDLAMLALDNPDPWVRFVAAEALGKFAGIQDAPAPTPGGNTVAQGAALSEPVAKRIARRLVEQFTRESHEGACAAIMWALAEIGWSEGLEALKQVRANAASWRFRYWAVKAIARSKKLAPEQLALAVNDERRAVRELSILLLPPAEANPTFDKMVAESAGKPGEYLLVFDARDAQWQAVSNALASANPEVRLHAAVACGRLLRKDFWQPLLAMASVGKLFDERLYALRSMKSIDDAAARPLITEAMQRETDKTKKDRLALLLQ